MPYDAQFESDLNDELDTLTKAQARVLAVGLSASFVAGWKLEDGGTITPTQDKAIQKLAASATGYVAEFNSAIGTQVIDRILELKAEGVLNKNIAKEILPYIDEVFGPDGKVVINNIGKKRSIIKVAKDGTLSKVDKVITQKYTTNPQAYADLLARTTTHNALEQGRAEARISNGKKFWRFSGPLDERSRPDHSFCVGNIYEYGTKQSDYAQEMLSAPNCRHRSIEYFNDQKLDVPQSHYDKLKKDAGLKFEDGEWTLPPGEL